MKDGKRISNLGGNSDFQPLLRCLHHLSGGFFMFAKKEMNAFFAFKKAPGDFVSGS